MACPTNRTTILNGIKNKIMELSGLQREGDRLLDVTEEVLDYVNNLFEEEVILEDGSISVSDELVDYYEQAILAEQANTPNIAYLQDERSEDLPKASRRTLDAIHDFLQRAGVKVQEVYDIVINGKKLTANGAALPLQSLVLYTQGNEDITLAEEAFHIGVELLSQKEPTLFNQMMSEITSYPLYKKVLAEYKDSPTYQKDGKPDLQKIKKEAIGKLLAQRVQDRKTHSWWTKLKNFLKSFFTGFMTELDTFTKAVDLILQEDLGTVRDTLLKSEAYLTSQGLSEEQAQEVSYLAFSNITDDELRIAIANMLEGYAFLQQIPKGSQTAFNLLKDRSKDIEVSSDGKTAIIDDKPIKNTFISWAESTLKTKISKVSKEYNRIMRDIEGNATALSHLQATDVLRRFIDEDGTLLDVEKTSPRSALFDDGNYFNIETEVLTILGSFPEGTKYLANTNIYNEAKDLAGKVDLIALTPDGKANIVMFQETNFQEDERMNPAERQALTSVVDAIRLTLKTDYKIHEFGLSRIVPFNRSEDNGVVTIQVGVREEKNKGLDYLYPIPSQYETTGNPKLDKALQNIGKLYSKYHKSSDKKEQLELNDMLSGLMRGARSLQVKKNVSTLRNQASRVAAKAKELVEEYHENWANLDPKKASKADIQKFSQELLIIYQIASNLEDLNSIVGSITDSEFSKVETLKEMIEPLSDVIWNFTNKFSAERNGIQNLLSPEVIQNTFNKVFRGISQSNIAAVELLGKLTESAKRKSEIIRNEYIHRVIPIQKAFKQWLQDNNISSKNQLDLITQKDSKGRYIHKLVEQYDISFYEGVVKARENNDIEWVNKNIDLERYEKDFQEYKKNKLEVIEDSARVSYEYLKEEEIQEIINERIANEIDIFDLSKGVSQNNSRLKNYPLQQYSPEYMELLKPQNKPALDLYNLIREQNQQAFELGVLTDFEARTFIPFKRLEGVGDRLIYGGKRKIISDLGRNFTITEEEAEFVNTDEISGELKQRIPFYMLYDISSKRIDPETGEAYRDYSDVSTDIFELLDLFNFQNTKYELYTGIEAELRNVSTITRTKQALETTTFGEASKSEGTVDNRLNADYFDTLLELTLYGRKNTGASYDKKLGTISNKFAKRVNSLLGSEVLDENQKDRSVSLSNTMDTVKRWFVLKTLALKLPTAAASFLGTTLTGSLETGTFFTKKEWWTNWLRVTSGKIGERFSKGDDVKLGLLNYFMLLNSDENNRQTSEQLTLNNLKKVNIAKWLMSPLNYADRPALYANGLSYLSNTMLVDGKFVNIREYVKKQSNWADLPTEEERKAKQQEDNARIQELKETQALDKIAYFDEDGKLIIPGVERTSDEVAELRARIINLGTNVVGMTDEMRGGQGNALFRMFMTFKSWMPRQLSRRFDKLRYTPGTDTYDWGRYQVFGNFLHQIIKNKGQGIVDLLSNSDKGIAMLKEEYENQRQAYYARTGKELDDNFTETQFIELYQNQVKNTFIEFSYVLALYGLFLSIGAMAPDDDDDLASKNFFKYSLKVMDKGLDEMLFYVNPKEALNIANGGIMPPLSVVKDIMKASDHLSREIWGNVTGDNELAEKAQPTKYVLKSLPLGGAVILPLLAMSQADLAKELGYQETDPMDHLQ